MTRQPSHAGRHLVQPPHGPARRLGTAALAGVLALTLSAGAYLGGRRLLGRDGTVTTAVGPPGTGAAAVTSPATASPSPSASSPAPPSEPAGDPSATASGANGTADQALAAGLSADDRAAGLLSAAVPQRGTGKLVIVQGALPAPGPGPVKRVRVEVEQGLDVDGDLFAAFVLQTLNDPRSWGHGGRMTFARTAGPADIRVVLASPDTSARLCAPLVTMGTLSCGQGNTAVLTLYRWVKAVPDYGTDRDGYRHYVVNHEVGHTLGHGHELCPGTGRVAPVMMQQTKGLKGCLPNSWPYP